MRRRGFCVVCRLLYSERVCEGGIVLEERRIGVELRKVDLVFGRDLEEKDKKDKKEWWFFWGRVGKVVDGSFVCGYMKGRVFGKDKYIFSKGMSIFIIFYGLGELVFLGFG